MIKLNRSFKQYLKLAPSADYAMPNGNGTIFFTKAFDGITGGDVEQIFLATTESKQLGGLIVQYRTNGSWLSADVKGKIRVYIEGVLDAAGNTLVIVSKDRFIGGVYQFAIRRFGSKLQLFSCLVDGQENNPVVLQGEVTVNVGFTHPQGILIGNRPALPPDRFSDQSVSRVGQVNVALTVDEISKMAFGVPIQNLSKTVVWYGALESLNDLGDFVAYNNPMYSPEPIYGYKEGEYGTFEKPFSINSLWNNPPVNPILGSSTIPACYKPGMARINQNKFYIDITAGEYSSGVFEAKPTDGPMTIYKPDGYAGIYDKDADEYRDSMTFPHWPADAFGAEGTDGHCDIIDFENKIIHSFWILKKNIAGKITARQYTWAPLDKSGWGEGAHYYIGARATGVPTCAGMIRKHEINDGEPMYKHALACSLDYTGLAKAPAYVSPATSSDYDVQNNSGQIPQGALLMLPASYNTARLDRWPTVKKVAETLKVYGARVVDRNVGSPMTIYVEKNAGWRWHPDGVWDQALANELEYLRDQIRSATMDSVNPAYKGNLLSMRGPWYVPVSGNPVVKGMFDSLNQRLRLPTAGGRWKNTTSGFKAAAFKPVRGKYYKVVCESDCSASFRFTFVGSKTNGNSEFKETPALITGESVGLIWPNGGWYYVEVYKNPTKNSGYIKWDFVEVTEAEYLSTVNKVVW